MMKRLLMTILSLLIFSNISFAQDLNQAEEKLDKDLNELKRIYNTLDNGFKVKLLSDVSIKRISNKSLLINFNIPKWSCISECSESNKTTFQHIIDSLSPLLKGMTDVFLSERNGGIVYQDNKGDISLELSKLTLKKGEDDSTNDFLDSVFEYLNVQDTASLHIKMIVEKETNNVLLIDSNSFVSKIKLPKKSLNDQMNSGNFLAGLTKFLTKLQKVKLEGKVILDGLQKEEEGIAIKGYFKGVAKLAAKTVTGDIMLFDAFMGFYNPKNDHFFVPMLDPDSVQEDDSNGTQEIEDL